MEKSCFFRFLSIFKGLSSFQVNIFFRSYFVKVSDMSLFPIGHKNSLIIDNVHFILKINTPPTKSIKTLLSVFGRKEKLVDTSKRRKKNSLILTNDEFIVLSSIHSSTLQERFEESGHYFMKSIVNVGFDNYIPVDQIAMILSINKNPSAPIAKILKHKKRNNQSIDATYGRPTKSVVVTTNGYIFLTAFASDSMAGRCNKKMKNGSFFTIGHGHYIPSSLVDSISIPNSKPNKLLIDSADAMFRLFKLNKDVKRQSLITLSVGFFILCHYPTHVVAKRLDDARNIF